MRWERWWRLRVRVRQWVHGPRRADRARADAGVGAVDHKRLGFRRVCRVRVDQCLLLRREGHRGFEEALLGERRAGSAEPELIPACSIIFFLDLKVEI